MLNATIIGKYFLSKNHDFTEIQIQKLVYYSYAWYMVKNNGKKLFDESPQAWIHGPVFRSLFDSMKNYENFSNLSDVYSIGNSVSNFLELIYKVYGKFSGNELERMTHSESPWINARHGLKPYEFSTKEIKDEDILNCYGNVSS